MSTLAGPFTQYGALILLGIAVTLAVNLMLSVKTPGFMVRGHRAGNRQRALQDSPLMSLFLPVIHLFTAYTLSLQLGSLRARIELWLRQAGEPAGLVPSEVIGLCLLCGLGLGCGTAFVLSPLAAAPAALLGLYLPINMVRSAAGQRIHAVTRSIPMMINLIALSMESGMDFVNAVRLVTSRSAAVTMPIVEELRVLLNQLHLGRARRDALEELGRRVPAEAIQTLVACIVQAEEKGMPLLDVLRIQAEVLRQKRVQEAEAYISIANMQMLIPILLVVAALMAVLMVPMVIGMSSMMEGLI